MSNTLRIKRRTSGSAGAPASLYNGELAHNEIDDTVYIGKGANNDGTAVTVVPVAGKGAFVDRSSDQSVAGVKTFTVSPKAPTPPTGDSSTSLATTAFVATATAAPVVQPNTVRAGPASGTTAQTPTYRALVPADIPVLNSTYISDFSAAADLRIANASGQTVCPLDQNKLVPAAYLPSYVDDVLEVSTYSALPATGEKGKIYVTTDTNYEYRWGGSAYVRLVASPGSSDEVPEGTQNLYFTPARVLATVLQGFVAGANAVVTASDSILQALQKLQGQVTARLQIANNLSDLQSAPTARTNLGLGTVAVQNANNVSLTGGTLDNFTLDGGVY